MTPDTVLISFRDVSRRFSTPRRGEVDALCHVSLDCRAGRITGIVGPSGSGKTTLLRLAAGLDQPTAGEIVYPQWGPSVAPPPWAVVTQEGNLLPWRNIRRNITLPMRLRNVPRREANRRAETLLRQMHLPNDVALSYPHELSGGMRRRAAVATALACRPQLLMLDEPFSGVDEATRRRLGQQVLDLRMQYGQSILLVTHDIEEALLLGDEVVILTAAPGIERVDIELPHPRDPLAKAFERRLIELRHRLTSR
ncbi:MAG: ATP-binding cassette domain-containing protein [Planctomycetes bacterium]|jgi:NitT/TauT family transport system ATP-binding protein|nr:ATP-binding cassette domain-containing protein [Planctomycetota bacterium]